MGAGDSETAALSPRMKVGSGGDLKSRSKALPSAVRPPLDPYRGSSDRGYRDQGSSAPASRLKAISQQRWVEGRPAASGESQSRSSLKESARSSRQDSRVRGMDKDYVGSSRGEEPQSRTGGQMISPSYSQTRSSQREESARSTGQQSSSRQDPRTDKDRVFGYRGETGSGVSGQPQSSTGNPQRQWEYTSGDSNRIPYAARDNRSSTIPGNMMSTTARPSGRPLILTTSAPQVQAQGSLGPQRTENTWMRDPWRPSGQDQSSNPSVGTMGSESHPYGSQPTGPSAESPARPSHRVFFHSFL